MTSQTSHDPSRRSVPDRFESFDLSIQRIGEAYRARVIASPVLQPSPVAIDPSGLSIESPSIPGSSKPTRDVRRSPVDREDLRRVGERLFKAVFKEAVIECFRASVEKVRAAGAGLQVCLLLDEAPELVALPWEALWDPKEQAYLADMPDLPLVRALRGATEAQVRSQPSPPLRVLALLPEPRGEKKLGGATEWRQILEHLQPLVAAGLVQTELLEPPTLAELGDRVNREPCHVLHIVAHGEREDPEAGGTLILESASGGRDRITGDDLARALSRHTPPRLVVINACHGAHAAEDDAFDGLPQRLLKSGVPAVVAMRSAISDEAAVSFSAALYRQLAFGRTVEAAVVEARHTLALGGERAEWATPALYLRGANMRIFEAGLQAVSPLISKFHERRRRSLRRGAAAITAAVLLAALAWWMLKLSSDDPGVPPESPDVLKPIGLLDDPCPPPPGLQDLQFVKIDEGVVNAGERTIVVEKPFCIATMELSRRDWHEVMGGDLPREDWPLELPMTHVTPSEVNEFMGLLENRDHGVTYRLPTADEWEFSARAGAKTDFFFGDDPEQLYLYGNCENKLSVDGAEGVVAIGSYKPNDWGLYDAHGNVAEWVQWPEDEGEPLNAEGHEVALRMGGSADSDPLYCSFASPRSIVRADAPYRADTGFRVVRELPSTGAETER